MYWVSIHGPYAIGLLGIAKGGVLTSRSIIQGARELELRLTLDQLAALRTEINRGVFHTIGEVREWVETTWGVVYTYWGMRSVLDRLHVHSKVPRPQAVDADPVAQAAWKEDGATHALEAAQVTRAMHITWADEFRIGLFGGTRNVLAEVGVKVIQLVELQRDWYHLALTVDPKGGALVELDYRHLWGSHRSCRRRMERGRDRRHYLGWPHQPSWTRCA